jgi:hypothetical protein
VALLTELRQALAGNRAARRLLNRRLEARREQARRLARRIKLVEARRGVPNWLPDRHVDRWRKPWTSSARGNANFRALLWSRGYLSPHFTRAEAMSKDGTPIPGSLQKNAQDHAFALEQVRHRLGDRPMRFLSWYRSPAHNEYVGGAPKSRHLYADATDWSDAERIRLGSAAFDAAMKTVFADGGIGTYQGHVRHVDLGPKRTWTY